MKNKKHQNERRGKKTVERMGKCVQLNLLSEWEKNEDGRKKSCRM